MTLKYESEILFDLMKRDGDDAPSDVLPYESELKEKYLNQVVGAYPKLQDYRPEWLNYNLYKYLPADFPVESVSNVTNATFENVVPYAYKSAILKGNTLVNLLSNEYSFVKLPTIAEVELNSAVNTYNAPDVRVKTIKLNQNLQANKKYIFLLNVVSLENGKSIGGLTVSTSNEQDYNIPRFSGAGLQYKIFETKFEVKEISLYLDFNETTPSIAKIKQPILMEYQEGMENWDIPYFEGMKSVQMPVLTTTGKNLLNKNEVITGAWFDTTNGQIITRGQDNVIWEKIKVEPNTNYISSNGVSTFWVEFDSNFNLIKITNEKSSIQTTSDTKYITVAISIMKDYITDEFLNTCQLECGTQVTYYEPYKSNILTVNEDVTLRGVGDVKDTLDCLTGQVTKRIEEIVLDGSESWLAQSDSNWNNDTYISFRTEISDMNENAWGNGRTNCISNKFKTIALNNESYKASDEFIGTDGVPGYPKYFNIKLLRSRLSGTETIDGFKQWLSQNPITIQYVLATPTIKTVDLTCTNEQGQMVDFMPFEGVMHVETSSDTLLPLLDMEVPVEAINQNLASFIEG